MTTLNSTQNTSPSRAWKKVLGVFNFLLPFAFIFAFAFTTLSAMAAVSLFAWEFAALAVVLGLFALISGTHVLRHNALKNRQQAIEKIQMQTAAGIDSAPYDSAAAEAIIPSYASLLQRNSVVALFYVPFMFVMAYIVWRFAIDAVNFGEEADKEQNALLLRLFAGILVLGWYFLASFVWNIIATFVDTRLLRTILDLPEDETMRVRRGIHGQPFRQRIAQVIADRTGNIFSGLILILVMAGPLVVVLPALSESNLPGDVQRVLAVALTVGYPLLLSVISIVLLSRLATSAQLRLVKTAAAQAIMANPENAAAIQTDVKTYQDQTRIATKSLVARANRRLLIMLLLLFFVILIATIFASNTARTNGATKQEASDVAATVLGVGGLLAFLSIFTVGRLIMPKSKGQKLFVACEPLMRSGKYDEMLPLVDEAMAELPNWETKLFGSLAYAQAGRLSVAERIMLETLRELAQMDNTEQRSLYKTIMANGFGGLAEIYVYDGRLEEAQTAINKALELGKAEFPHYNTIAKLALYRNAPDEALPALDAAVRGYQAAHKPPSAYNKSLRAWAMALKKDRGQAEAIIQEALQQVPPEHMADRAEVLLFEGYMRRALGESQAARRVWRQAFEADLQGANGIVAKRELDLSAAS